MRLRPYVAEDAGALAGIFFDAVRIGAAPKYSAAELAAWAPERPTATAWAKRLAGLWTVVAEAEGRPLGFMSLAANGYLDLAFVAPDQRGRGVADALWLAVQAEARARGLHRLTTEASRMARPFFLRHGWQVEAAQQVQRHGVMLENFRMFCTL
ncbi:GNAT family N-acetyltransferase [Fertoebacter nigrum]|uniref:GNAT family N-acetyltransferase n=1 Tax=Fertoeibacter niger TaxID=2656921 RepID=A0A8X8GY10_9RHOB|nr:GNAT family N-acetyltransferase [Fertoeibacter niger]NUB43903.1 GNAT family N-acetyltransferase [Fertoeibacter niger]